jgi:hypothetical protein
MRVIYTSNRPTNFKSRGILTMTLDSGQYGLRRRASAEGLRGVERAQRARGPRKSAKSTLVYTSHKQKDITRFGFESVLV